MMDPLIRYCRNVLRVIAELHLRGYQRLRIGPGLSSSGFFWRCAITPVSNILIDHGALLLDYQGPVAKYTVSMGNQYWGWTDATDLAPSDLADLFVERFPDIVMQGKGRDWLYAGWYVEMLSLTYPDLLPIAYADHLERTLDTPQLHTWKWGGGREVFIPMPPPGEAR